MGRSENITFEGSRGVELAGRLDLPDGVVRACALFAHCLTCSKDVVVASRISRALAARGIAVLRFDFTGLGGSGGELDDTTFSSNVQDLVAAARYLREEVGPPELLVGHSLGGAAVLIAAHEVPECRLVATVGAPCDPAHVEKPLIAKLGRALIIFHSPTDEQVGIDNARQLYETAKHPKSFVSLDGADHLLTNRQDADYVGAVVAAWAGRYLSSAGAEPLPVQPHGHAIVRESGQGELRQEMRLGPHLLTADEPIAAGGDDTGPSPYELLLGALGSCTAMTMRMYARRKKWPLERATVHLSHEKRHAEDCEGCEQRPRRLDHIEREIVLEGDLSPEQRARLIEIADKCPVHRTLHDEVRIDTRERR